MNLILLSGGLDSALCLARYGAVQTIGFDYGQRHIIELDYAERIASHYGVRFSRIRLPLIPLIDDVVFAGRNLVMLSVAISYAKSNDIDTILIGCNLSDARRFADCRPEFIEAMNSVSCNSYGIRISAPLLTITKAQVIREAKEFGIPATWTCYSPTKDGKQCGDCYACKELQC